MKRIKSKRHAALAAACLCLAGLCLAVQLAGRQAQPRYLTATLLLLALATANGLRAAARLKGAAARRPGRHRHLPCPGAALLRAPPQPLHLSYSTLMM